MTNYRKSILGDSVGSCCYQCEKRHPACHDNCEKYQESKNEWLKKQAYLKEARKSDRLYNDYHIIRVKKAKRTKEGKKGH